MIYITMADTNISLDMFNNEYKDYVKLQLKSIGKIVDISDKTPTYQFLHYIDHDHNEFRVRIDYKNIILWEE